MIHITKHSGKMLGISSISTSTLTNSFCQQMRSDSSNICSKCYAVKLENIRPGLRKNLQENSDLLSKPLANEDIPNLSKHRQIRINSFGELINDIHLQNIIKIAEHNLTTNVVLYTKRIDILNRVKYEKPNNLIIILSSPKLNTVTTNIPESVNKIFTVYTKDGQSDTEINCAQSCAKCMKCYKQTDETFYISELVK